MSTDPAAARLPALAPDELDPRQREAYDELVAGPRGALSGPFVPLLRSPELMRRVQKVGELLRFGETSLSPALRELVVLMTARRWGARYEWASHVAGAAAAGVDPEACAAVAAGRPVTGLPPDLQAGHDLAAALLAGDAVSEEVYAHAVEALGEPATVEVAVLAGYYTTLAFVLSTGAVDAPDPAPPLPPLPRA